jgi:hypothetical protein
MAASISNQEDFISPSTVKRDFGAEAQSAFASTLVNDVDPEKLHRSTPKGPSGVQYGNLFRSTIENPDTRRDGDELFAAKAQLLNDALLDIGMGPFQWFLFALTSVGWFLDSVSYTSIYQFGLRADTDSSGWPPSPSSPTHLQTKLNSSTPETAKLISSLACSLASLSAA